ncbi:beta-lactamase domain protein [Chloroherpeton thalassium ATCC 35110]|uniref:Beta-lactamase domain protein n=1 Tax=Chloroherpeton thalassium (strain ATCC 35110 / GB-78) TaxID=517418 RepID=B3QRS8_CHLT3|nr:FprA family A-type flavoprotein [Chloroherpeton thalassium]ACF13881.1 beta-lactamase domain protein [Chloroherpeton thalassium ATCC 35110]
MQKVNISDDIFWVGVNDRRTELFENMWPIPQGVCYNSYIINDEKVAIVDTVEVSAVDEYLDKLEQIIGDDRTVDYLIINHMEPDHSGAVRSIRQKYPNVAIVGNKKTFEMLEKFYGISDNLHLVEDGDELELGSHKLKFYMTPMLHWPETMMTYDQKDKILFSGDAFGSFGTLDGGVFDDELNMSFYDDEIRRYYSNIVGKFAKFVQKALQKLSTLEVKVIAATHGPIWREGIKSIIDRYDRWSRYQTEEGVVIVYGTMYGNTEQMADVIGRELAENGIKNIHIFDSSKTNASYIISQIYKYKGVILGSCAYNNDMFPNMESLIRKIENGGIQDHMLGVFGSFAWSGGGVKRLNEFAENIKWEIISDSVEQKGGMHDMSYDRCVSMARNMAKRLKETFA